MHTTLYLGAAGCVKMDEEDIMSVFFEVMHGERWPKEYKKNWQSKEFPVCDWEGILCEADGTIIGISFPISETDIGGDYM